MPATLLLPLCLSLVLFWPWPVQAADSHYLELTVADESRATQDAAFAEAMRQLLERVTGQAQLWLQPAYADLVGSAWQYVEKFNFQAVPGDPQRRVLRCWFDSAALREALVQRGFQWRDEPAQTLLWLLQQEAQEAWLMAPDEPGSLYAEVPALAQRLGLPLHVPLVDLQERLGFVGSAGEAAADASLVSLSQRYDADALLIGRIGVEQGRWRIDWHRLQQGHSSRWSETGEQVVLLLEQGLRQLAAPPPQPVQTPVAESLQLAVTGLDGPDDTRRVLDALQALSLIVSVRLGAVDDGWQVFDVDMVGERAALLTAVSFGGLLVPTEPPQPRQPKRPKVHDPLAELSLPGRSQAAKQAPPAPPQRLYLRRRD